MKRILTNADIAVRAKAIAAEITEFALRKGIIEQIKIYPVPRGGVPAAYAVLNYLHGTGVLIEDSSEAEVILDDLVDSGSTMRRYMSDDGVPYARFFALIEKGRTPGFPLGEWLVFPWEETEEKSIEDSFIRLLQYVGEDPHRGGLVDTPARMSRAWKFWTKGYAEDPIAVLKTFEDGGEVYDELVHVGHIPFYSQCEHHLAPFFGEVFFGYIPDKKIVGLSKMNRLVDCFARRLQVQERLTSQVIDTFCGHLSPKGAGIVVRARHLCMESRGVCQQGCMTTTAAFRGAIKEQPAARAEFFSLTNAPRSIV